MTEMPAESDPDRMTPRTRRVRVAFASGADNCAAWLYVGDKPVCIVMAGGLGATKEPATDRYAAALHANGYSVVAFDYRHCGESGGVPRNVVQVNKQRQDWAAALDFVGTHPRLSGVKVVVWGFSLSSGHLFHVAGDRSVAGAVLISPTADGQATSLSQLRHTTFGGLTRFMALGVADAVGGLLGRDPVLVPLTGERGSLAALTTPDSRDVNRALDPDGTYSDWSRVVAARSALRLGAYRPGRAARDVHCPVLLIASTDDQSAPFAATSRAAKSIELVEVVRLTGGHYAAFLDSFDHALAAQVEFLDRLAGLALA